MMARMYLSGCMFTLLIIEGLKLSTVSCFLLIWKMPELYPPAQIMPGATSHSEMKMRFLLWLLAGTSFRKECHCRLLLR